MELSAIATLVSVISGLSGILLGWVGVAASRKRDAADMGSKLAAMQTSILSSNDRLDEILQKIDDMQHDYSGLLGRVAKLESYCEGMHRQHDELEGRVSSLEKRMGYSRQ